MKQTNDDGHRKKPNNENRKSNSKSVFRLLSARKIVGHLKVHANFVFQAFFSKLKNEKRKSAINFRFSKGRDTRAIFFSRRQGNGSNFIGLLARVIKLHVSHTLRGNAIVTACVGQTLPKVEIFQISATIAENIKLLTLVWAGNVKAIFSQPMKFV